MSSFSMLIYARGAETLGRLLTTTVQAEVRSPNHQTAAVHQVPQTAAVAAQEPLTDDCVNYANVHREHEESSAIGLGFR